MFHLFLSSKNKKSALVTHEIPNDISAIDSNQNTRLYCMQAVSNKNILNAIPAIQAIIIMPQVK